MPRLIYKRKNFAPATQVVIAEAINIIEEYAAQGFALTLRQLYYQFVARGMLPNRDTEYKRLGGIVSDARMAGYIDWDAIEDRTRNLEDLAHWETPEDIIASAARSFRQELWADQPRYVEVWIEKDALKGVIQGVCEDNDVPYFSCRGYTSQSEMWGASQRILERVQAGKEVHILHLGDHDPSGIDMTRDIHDRIFYFLAVDLIRDGMEQDEAVARVRELFHVDRLALNMEQVDRYGPPPNPAKLTDSRARDYIEEYGPDSWELDALEPTVLSTLIAAELDELRDHDIWQESVERQEEERQALTQTSDRWDEVKELVLD